MDKQIFYEQIEAYLAGTLPSAEQEALERQIAADPALAAELELHRRLQSALSDVPKNRFRRQLDDLAKEFPPPPSGAWRRWWWAPVLAVLAVLLLWYVWPAVAPGARQNPGTQPVVSPPDSPATVPQPVDSLPQQQRDSVAAAPHADQRRQAFAPNPALEKLVDQAVDPYYAIETARTEAAPGDTAGAWKIVFFGKMLSAMDPPVLVLQLRSNSRQSAQVLASIPVTVTPLPDDQVFAFGAKKAYSLSAVQSLRLKRGLYYTQLKSDKPAEILWTGRLMLGH